MASHYSTTPQKHASDVVVATPCGACKMLRKRCVEKCILAPHFPPTEPIRFTMAHRVFGASNIIKLLQELKEYERADAVSSMVYEANARIIDPVYGSVGTIFQLQNQVNELQAQLAKAKAEIFNMNCQLEAMVSTEMCRSSQTISQQIYDEFKHDSSESSSPFVYLDNDQDSSWDIIWA
ncbi:putative transcription factor AS2-LOB family [Helianthus annuus]|nr:putative transcription factor AS2-LOB family [Helianthus annuus]KAJ0568186.1 putative transcription factor AS2-LOB family [Helianthus annuus]KAJ0916600.1 putative transcription factor AS2-LOB family [Helianthus annuus]